MTTTTQCFPGASIDRLVDKAQAADKSERRTDQRHPYFRPVKVSVQSGRNRFSFAAFSRDISKQGMGLLHQTPLKLGEAIVHVAEEDGEDVVIPGEVKSCESCGEGWYLSGVQFIN